MTAPQLRLLDVPQDATSDAQPYLAELGVQLLEAPQKIQFNHNGNATVHRWSPYVQGFSGHFVRTTLEKYWDIYRFGEDDRTLVYDPFAGVGTVLVEAKKLGVRRCAGSEMNPLLSFLANVKLSSWNVAHECLWDVWEHLHLDGWSSAPPFLESERHFRPEVLDNLQRLRGAIELVKEKSLRDLFKVAFASILIECSNLKRTPSLGYSNGKAVEPEAPWSLMALKLLEICEDLRLLQLRRETWLQNKEAYVAIADAKEFEPGPISLVITSPPYMNGMDYVMNYKIEMAWLGFIASHREAKQIKDKMVACDNVSHEVTGDFAQRPDIFRDPWLTEILEHISHNIDHWDEGHAQTRIQRNRKVPHSPEETRRYRRRDMPLIVHKYFDDMFCVMRRLCSGLQPSGRIVLVLGDSLIADVYVPTDLIIAKMGQGLGLDIESVEKVRNRRSGQVRSYQLRESVVTLVRPMT